MSQPIDLLCLAPHPDDAEICCGGLLLLAKRAGARVGIVDCTRGEMATRGSARLRQQESRAADRLLGTDFRVNLGLRDGGLRDDDRLRRPLVNVLRGLRPRLLLAPYWEDQHPDHAALGQATEAVAWLCGAPRYAPGSGQAVASPDRLPYRPELVLYYNNRYGIEADLVVDITPVMEAKLALIACYPSQVGLSGSGKNRAKREPLTKLSSEKFRHHFHSLHGYYGFKIGAEYGEPYATKGPLPVRGIEALLGGAS